MSSIHDAAAYILASQGMLGTFHLHRLLYFVWRESTITTGTPMFSELPYAWAGGPAFPALYEVSKGAFKVEGWPHGDAAHLTREERSTILAVLYHFRGIDAESIAAISQHDPSWIRGREGLLPAERGNNPILPEWVLDAQQAAQTRIDYGVWHRVEDRAPPLGVPVLLSWGDLKGAQIGIWEHPTNQKPYYINNFLAHRHNLPSHWMRIPDVA